jgi:AraC family transcriptional regulator
MQTSDIVQRAIDYIEEHLYDSLELDGIASASAMSVPNLYRLFYALTGHPIKEYIRKRRISEAAFLLRKSILPANEIGYQLGFETYQTFIKAFKRTTGLTPGLYKQSELIYSFERISIHESVSYFEDREVTACYSDVRVIRLAPQSGVGYLHTSSLEEGLEDEAIEQFRNILAKSNLDAGKMKIFGWNVDLDEEISRNCYQMIAVGKSEQYTTNPTLQLTKIQGGLYAVTRISAESGSTIIAAWNRLLSEWLPQSTFELGNHGFLEEYQQYSGQIARLKLYLPVRRRQVSETIEIVTRSAWKVICFRSEGADCSSLADKASVNWLVRNRFAGDPRLHVFMSCSYGNAPDEEGYYEIFISLPKEFAPLEEDAQQVMELKSGLYACLKTSAYGTMTGVLDRIYRWLGLSADYLPDENRIWFAHYVPDQEAERAETNFELTVGVECYVPIILRK